MAHRFRRPIGLLVAPSFRRGMQREELHYEYRIRNQDSFDVFIASAFHKRFDCRTLDHIPRRAGIFNFLSIQLESRSQFR